MVNLTVMLIDLCSSVIYLELIWVHKFQRHLYTFVLESQIIAQKQIKPYANAYRASLKRDWFCLLDKIQVNGLGLSNVA